MKKTLLATTFLVAIMSAAFADGKKANAKLLSDLQTALKSVNESAWKTTDLYKKTTFVINGTKASAFIDTENGKLIGFGIPINATNLPAGAIEDIEKKFEGWQLTESIMFIKADGNTDYFARVAKGKNDLALKISAKGKANIYARMPQ